jgi:hypothetical protein
VLTSSSDSRVILNNLASISSEPYGHLIDDEADDDEEKDKNRSLTVYPHRGGIAISPLPLKIIL